MTEYAEAEASMRKRIAATIPRPSICRMVVLGFKDPTQRFSSDPHGLTHRADDPHELPAVVVRVVDEDTLRIECVLVGGPEKTLWRAYHRDLCPDDAGPYAYVWTWPPRSP